MIDDKTIEDLMKYVFWNIGDGCPKCVGESVYRFYCIFADRINFTLDELFDIVGKSRLLMSGDSDLIRVNIENGGKWIAEECQEVLRRVNL